MDDDPAAMADRMVAPDHDTAVGTIVAHGHDVAVTSHNDGAASVVIELGLSQSGDDGRHG